MGGQAFLVNLILFAIATAMNPLRHLATLSSIVNVDVQLRDANSKPRRE